MSLSLAKRFMKEFDAQQNLGVKLKKSKKPKQKAPIQTNETKIQKLLSLNKSLDDELCKNVSNLIYTKTDLQQYFTVAFDKCNKDETIKIVAEQKAD